MSRRRSHRSARSGSYSGPPDDREHGIVSGVTVAALGGHALTMPAPAALRCRDCQGTSDNIVARRVWRDGRAGTWRPGRRAGAGGAWLTLPRPSTMRAVATMRLISEYFYPFAKRCFFYITVLMFGRMIRRPYGGTASYFLS